MHTSLPKNVKTRSPTKLGHIHPENFRHTHTQADQRNAESLSSALGTNDTYIYIYVYMYVNINYTYINVCTYECKCMHIIFTFQIISLYIHIYVSIHTCVYIYIYIYDRSYCDPIWCITPNTVTFAICMYLSFMQCFKS